MNEALMREHGFGQEVDEKNRGICPVCKKRADENEFVTDLEKVEFKKTGICKPCQDNLFSEPEEDE